MSLKPEYVLPAVVGACTAVVGAAIGYRMGIRGSSSQTHHKSYSTTDPLVKYATAHTTKLIPVQERLNAETLKHTMGRMMGCPDELHFLSCLCKALGTKKAIDIGVFTGCSSMSIALVLPEDGKVVACDVSTDYTDIGKPYWREAGVDKKIDLRIAPADESLRKMINNGESGTYDFAFIDADKTGYDTYYELCLKLIRPGGLIALDNMVQGGRVVDPQCNSDAVVAIRKLNDKIHNDDRVDSTLLLVGDGTVLAFKR